MKLDETKEQQLRKRDQTMPNTYTLLETISVGAAGASSVTFNSIPQTGYTDLIIKASSRTTTGGADNYNITFNGVTTGYTYKELTGNGTTVSSSNGSLRLTGLIDGFTMTASTFSNSETYIPNYTSSNYKSFTSDAVTENNLTLSYAQLWANLWSNTAAISTIALAPSGGSSFAQYSTFSLYGVSALGTTPTKAPKATGGDIIMTDGTYWMHTFLYSGTFKPATGLTCDYLVVAGGGGTSDAIGGGGGGGGGLLTATSYAVTSGSNYTVTIGAGGSGSSSGALPGSGSNSVFGSFTAIGGGGGSQGDLGGASSSNGQNGGSGGGGGGTIDFATGTGGTATSGQGYAGGYGQNRVTGGGGGGAGGAGGNAVNPVSGKGGNGLSNSYSGTATYYSAGGPGGYWPGVGETSGGAGTGGVGADTSGNPNTGQGAGGGNASGVKNGGSGIVIVRYLA